MLIESLKKYIYSTVFKRERGASELGSPFEDKTIH